MATQRQINEAVLKLRPDVGFSVTAEGVVAMADGSSPPTDSAIEAEVLKTKHKVDRTYPALSEQFDLLYHDIQAGKLGIAATTGNWYVGITSVKTAYPKP